MAGQNQAVADLMKQLLEGFNDLKGTVAELKERQAETQIAMEAVRAKVEGEHSEAPQQLPATVDIRATSSGSHLPPPSPLPTSTLLPGGAPNPAAPQVLSPQLLRPHRDRAATNHFVEERVGAGSTDRRDAHLFRGDAPGLLGPRLPAPGTGATNVPYSSAYRNMSREDEFEGRDYRESWGRPPGNHAPKMEFPKFDGENPKLWQQQCETYFEVFRVQECYKTRYAVLNFWGNAAL